jgi:hypothetical protein
MLPRYSPLKARGSASEFVGLQCCGTFVGVAALLESFYKPELDAAQGRRLQADRPIIADGVKIPSPGITDNWDFLA